jgi:hypothetical protein
MDSTHDRGFTHIVSTSFPRRREPMDSTHGRGFTHIVSTSFPRRREPHLHA